MRPAASIYTFGEFQLDAAEKRLTHNGDPIALTEHQADVLLELVSRPGEILTKDALIAAAWQGVAVTDNSLEQAVSMLRKKLGAGQVVEIETVPRRGYRFRGEVTRTDARMSDDDLAAMLEPHRALLEGRTALETLEHHAVERALRAFEAVVTKAPDYASAHLGLANACVMRFETTRADEEPDREALVRASHHAREACRLDPECGDAWATLALALHHTRPGVQAIAAARRAVMLEPDNWRHHLRLAYVAWGEERLRAAHKALTLFPGFGLAHVLAATVYVARQAFDLAERELRDGVRAQEAQEAHKAQNETRAFSSVGSHWLLGLLHLARGDEKQALHHLQRELAFESHGHLYGRECAANSWYAIGALELRCGRRREAAAGFERALERMPSHALAMIGLTAACDTPTERTALHARIHRRLTQLDVDGRPVESAMARAALAIVGDTVTDAAGRGADDSVPQHLDAMLAAAAAGHAGWLIPLDPLLNVSARQEAFAHVLARLRTRAG